MITRINLMLAATAFFAVVVLALFTSLSFAQPPVAEATELPPETTYPFKLTKNISDNYTPDPFTADEFKFTVSGYGVVTLTPHTNDTAEAVIYLPVGTYTVEEIGPEGFVPADWTVQWSGHGCVGDTGNGPIRAIDIEVVEAQDPDAGGNVCRADNQWRPMVEPILGCTNPTALNYNPAATQDDGSCDFEDEEVLGCTDPEALNYNQNATSGNPEAEDCEYDNGGQCVAEPDGSWADAVVSSNQGATKAAGAITNPDRIDASKTLGAADWVLNGDTGFFSLGFGGSIVLSFDSYVPNVAGTDLTIYEATNGDTYPAETATVEVSQNGTTWVLAGTANNTTVPDRTTAIDFAGTGLDWIAYVRITDTTNPTLHTDDADGFDLDAVKATEQVCDEPNGNGGDDDTYTIEGYKWHDTDGDGVKDENEAYIVGWEMTAEKVGALNSVMTTQTDENGFYSFTVSAGTWVVTEEYKEGWDQTFPGTKEGTCSVVFAQNAESATQSCAFGNQNINDEEEPTWLVFGYVWHDENENDTWDLEQPNPEDDESDLDGWTVQITNGVHTYATTTDASGYYFFYVPAGTWTINEIVEDGWDKTFPNENGHIVEVLGQMTFGEETNFFAMVRDFIVPTAHAAVLPTTYGPFNFGNVQEDGGGGGSNGGGGGGNGRNVSLRGGGSSSSNDDEPEGEVLGEAVSIMPVGAPNTGAGGTAPYAVQLPTLTAILSLSTSVRKAKNG